MSTAKPIFRSLAIAEAGQSPFDTAFGLSFDRLRTWLRMRFGYDLGCYCYDFQRCGKRAESLSEKWQARLLLVPLKCHCERSEAISTPEGDCFVAEFILSLSKGSSQ